MIYGLLAAVAVVFIVWFIKSRYIIMYHKDTGLVWGRRKLVGTLGVEYLLEMWENDARKFAEELPQITAAVLPESEICSMLHKDPDYTYSNEGQDFVSSIKGKLPFRRNRMSRVCGKRIKFGRVPSDHPRISYGKVWYIDHETGNSWEEKWLRDIKEVS